MDTDQHLDLYRLIRQFDIPMTHGETNVLISGDALTPECIVKIEEYIAFSDAQAIRLDADERERANLGK